MANDGPHNGGGSTATTRLCVCSDDPALSGIRREFVAAGWTASTRAELLAGPRRGTPAPALCVTQVDTDSEIGELVDLLLQGVSAAVLATDPALATDVFDQCRRVATAEWFDQTRRPVADQLTDDQLALLMAIRAGDDIERAARGLHLSPRTAARRLNDARRSLGARSTSEAVALVGRRIDELRGSA